MDSFSLKNNSNSNPERVGIHKAIVEGDLAQVQALLPDGVNIEQQDYTYQKPLVLAVELHHLEIIRTLIDAGATLFPGLLDIISKGITHGTSRLSTTTQQPPTSNKAF